LPSAGHRGHVVGDQVAAEVHVDQGLHQLPHIGVAVVDVGLDKVGNGRGDVAEVNLPELAHLGESTGSFENVFAGGLATFHPRAAAKTDANGGRVGDLECAHITVEGAEDVPRDAAELGNRRIIGMDADAHAGFLGDGGNLADEIRVVL